MGDVTHADPDYTSEGSVYTSVTDGIESSLERARAAAGEKDVAVMGGAEIRQQYFGAGLLDETSIHLVPPLFGSGPECSSTSVVSTSSSRP